MADIKYLKEHNLYEAHKHFMSLVEGYIPFEEEVDEAGENQQQDPNAMGGGAGPMMGGGDPNAMGGDPSMGGGMPQGPDTMGGDPSMGGDPNAMGGADPMAGGDPNAMGAPDMMGGTDEPEDDGNTIDIAGLTHAEDKLNVKQNQIGRDLSKVDSRIMSLIDKIGDLQSALDANNNELESLKAEFEKRNPTQTEKLNLRSLDSYPFNVKPDTYWKQKAAQGGYEAYADNSEPTTKEYVITNNDVDNPSKDIADTFFKLDDDDNQTLEKLFNL